MTTIEDEVKFGEETYIVRGEPVIQGLAWLVWGPVGAVAAVACVAVAAVMFSVQDQSGLVRAVFIALFLLLPAILWGGLTVLVMQRSKPYLEAVRQNESQTCLLYLNQKQGLLTIKSAPSAPEQQIAYQDIQQATVTFPIGEQDGNRSRLTLQTINGSLILLNEALGTRLQKQELAQKIQHSLAAHAKASQQ